MSAELAICKLQPQDYPAWDRLVAESGDGTVYHESWWLEAVSHLTKTPWTVYGAYIDGLLVGGAPFSIHRKGPLVVARRAWATPYANCVCANHVHDRKSVAAQLIKRVLRDCSHVTYTGSPFAEPVALGSPWNIRQRATFVLEISDLERAWSDVVYQLRKKIRKAQRNGLISAGPCPPRVFYELYAKTFTRRGMALPFTQDRFEEFWTTINKGSHTVSCLIVDRNQTPCAAGLALTDDKRAYYALAGTDVHSSALPASALLTWDIITTLTSTCSCFDLVGANIEGVVRFKKQFSPTLLEYCEAAAYRSMPERLVINSYGFFKRLG